MPSLLANSVIVYVYMETLEMLKDGPLKRYVHVLTKVLLTVLLARKVDLAGMKTSHI